MTRPSVLVTGATGFVGRHLVAHMLEQEWSTIAVVRSPSRAGVLPESPLLRLADLASAEDLEGVVRRNRPDVIIHLATHFVARHTTANEVRQMAEANIAFGMVLADAAARNGVPIVSASTVWQHYDGAPYEPVSLYAATKQALDDILRYYGSVEGLGWTRLVLGDTYGPDDTRGKLLTHLLNAALNQTPLQAASGLQLWDAVHVADVVKAFMIAATEQVNAATTREYQLRPPQSRTIREVVEVAQVAIERPIPVKWGARPDRGREMMHPWVVADAPPGWHPRIQLADGIREIWRSEYVGADD